MILPRTSNGSGKNGHSTRIITSVAATFIAGILLAVGVMIVRQTRENTHNLYDYAHRIELLEKAVFPGATPWPKLKDEKPGEG